MNLVIALVFFISTQAVAADLLFDENSDQPLPVVIETDLHKIKNKKSNFHTSTENFINGRIQIRGMEFTIKIQTRGHDRLKRCPFPPLKIYFDKSEVKNNFLKHNHKLKIVTHCQADDLELLFREHLIYRIYNQITPYSFRVRLLSVEYVDTSKKEVPTDTYAFFIESDKSVEKRLRLDELKSDQKFNMKTLENIAEDRLSTSQIMLLNAFQHLILNDDWVIFYSETARTLSLANIKFFNNNHEGFPIPYDFDRAGVVTWEIENYVYRHGSENLCTDGEMKDALIKILRHKIEYERLLNKDLFLSASYKDRLVHHLNQFNSPEDFCLDIVRRQQ